ncbi:MAG: calcium-binding protein [Pseudomonadota bacterium]
MSGDGNQPVLGLNIFGNLDDNILYGDGDSELIRGRDGNDIIFARGGDDTADGGTGDDVVFAGAGNDRVRGDDGEDALFGGTGNDGILAGAGEDTVFGGAGNDVIVGDTGDDLIFGGAGNDRNIWNNGDGSDTIFGGQDFDRQIVNGADGAGDNFEISNRGNLVEFQRTNLGLFELDLFQMEALNVNGGGGDDTISVIGEVAEQITLVLNGGEDANGETPDAETGDTLDLAQLDEGALVDLDIRNGSNTAGLTERGQVRNVSATQGEELSFSFVANDFENIIGTEFDDRLIGNAEANVISGLGGTDSIFGGDGDDVLVANKGDDFVFGGNGSDMLVWNNGDGSDLLDGGAGQDQVQVNFNTDLVNDDLQNKDVAEFSVTDEGVQFARVELNDQAVNGLFQLDIRNTEELETNFGGNDDTARLIGAVAQEIDITLNGDADTNGDIADATTGDTLDLSQVDEGVAVDLDVNFAGVAAPGLSQQGQVQNFDVISGGEETFSVAANDFENVIGTEFQDRIFGNAEANVLEGRGGDDIFHAFGGNDVYDGGEGVDTALFNQAIVGIEANLATGQVVAGDDVNTLISIENLNGGGFDDRITGDDGSNVLNGLAGNDVIVGGAGDNDVMTGGTGEDSFVFANGDGNGTPGNADQIEDFTVGDDQFALDAVSFGLDAEDQLVFSNVARVDDGADENGIDDSLDLATFDPEANVYVLQGAFANAGAAANAIADARDASALEIDETDEAGFFIYFNQGQGRARLFAVNDLNAGTDEGIQQVANLGDLVPLGDGETNADNALRTAALDSLETFTADEFTFDTDSLLS